MPNQSKKSVEFQKRLDGFIQDLSLLEMKYNLILVKADETQVVAEDKNHFLLRLAIKKELDIDTNTLLKKLDK